MSTLITWEFPEQKEHERYGARNRALCIILNIFPTQWSIDFADVVKNSENNPNIDGFVSATDQTSREKCPILERWDGNVQIFSHEINSWIQEGWRPTHIYKLEEENLKVSVWQIQNGKFLRVLIDIGDVTLNKKTSTSQNIEKIDPEHRLVGTTQEKEKKPVNIKARENLALDIAKKNLGITGDVPDSHSTAFLQEIERVRNVIDQYEELANLKRFVPVEQEKKSENTYWLVNFIGKRELVSEIGREGSFMLEFLGQDFPFDVAVRQIEDVYSLKLVVIRRFSQVSKETLVSYFKLPKEEQLLLI